MVTAKLLKNDVNQNNQNNNKLKFDEISSFLNASYVSASECIWIYTHKLA
jgi:hypothetical protein